ncbi:MAG: hypothetical protein ACT4SY_10965 [Hyphomicrobiales bacterium]
MELYLVYENARAILEKQNVRVVRSLAGSYITSLVRHWDAAVHTAALRWGM